MLTLDLIIDDATDELQGKAELPGKSEFQRFASAALSVAHHVKAAEICLSIVDSGQSRLLNMEYREKDKPTNVLSFPADLPDAIDIPLLGDIIICHSVIEQEALKQDKTLKAHYAHLTIHGVLHLLGFDHINDEEATVMETLEIKALNTLGFNNPYFIS